MLAHCNIRVLVSEQYAELSPFLQALAEREEPNRIGKMMVGCRMSPIKHKRTAAPTKTAYTCILGDVYSTLSWGLRLFQTIVFIRDKNSKGHEISGYIDLAERFEVCA